VGEEFFAFSLSPIMFLMCVPMGFPKLFPI
jgi:hypothetical protein